MLVFVDESGDTGFKLGQGSSGQFTITLVIFSENEEAEATSRRIDELRAELKLSEDGRKGEFHFNDNSNDQREAFLIAVSKFDFTIFSVVVDKAGLALEGISNKSAFYNFICGLVFDSAKHRIAEATITIDSMGGQEFKRQLEKYLKQRMNEPGGIRRIKQIRMKPSHTDNLPIMGGRPLDLFTGMDSPSSFRRRQILSFYWCLVCYILHYIGGYCKREQD